MIVLSILSGLVLLVGAYLQFPLVDIWLDAIQQKLDLPNGPKRKFKFRLSCIYIGIVKEKLSIISVVKVYFLILDLSP